MKNTLKSIRDLDDATTLLNKIKKEEITVESVVTQHLKQLETINPEINAATKIYNEKALKEAKALDQNAHKNLPLFGLPCSIKETFAVSGEELTAGSIRRKPQLCEHDSTIVRKLKAAGAIIIARSNIPEFAMTGDNTNLRFGRTNNPLDTTRTSGGSSGGEGAIVGSGSSAFGVGSDILGSIRIPAAFCGTVGFKPHAKAVDGEGTWPEIQDSTLKDWLCYGPLTRSVRDAQMVYNVIAHNPIPETENTFDEIITPEGFPIKYEQACIKKAVNEAKQIALNNGFKERKVNFDKIPKLFLNIPKLVITDFYDQWIKDLSSSEKYGKFSVIKEIFAHIKGKPTIDHGLLKCILLKNIMKVSNSKKKELIENSYINTRKEYQELIGENGVIVLPTLGLLAPKHYVFNRKSLLDPRVNGLFTSHTMANYLDLPTISIPAWKHKDKETGLAPSVSLICNPGQEDKLFAFAKIVEKALN